MVQTSSMGGAALGTATTGTGAASGAAAGWASVVESTGRAAAGGSTGKERQRGAKSARRTVVLVYILPEWIATAIEVSIVVGQR